MDRWLTDWLFDRLISFYRNMQNETRSKNEAGNPLIERPIKTILASNSRKCVNLLSAVMYYVIIIIRLADRLFVSLWLKVDLAMDVERALPRGLRKQFVPKEEVVRPNQCEGFKGYWHSLPISARGVHVALKPFRVRAHRSISNKRGSSWDT